jgi:hypothetical protein
VPYIPDDADNGQKYGPAMEIVSQWEADAYFDALVDHQMRWSARYRPLRQTREEAENHERSNLGYYSGYYSHDVRARVERLFRCVHPMFGSVQNVTRTPEEIFQMGQDWARGIRPEVPQPSPVQTIWDRLGRDET